MSDHDLTKPARQTAEESCRAACRSVGLSDGTVLAKVLTRFNLYLDGRDAAMTPHLALDGFWEMWLTLSLQRTVMPGDVCVDAGANVGYYTVLMSHLAGPTGHVHAFEPVYRTREILKRSVAANGGGNVTVHPYALGESAASSHIGYSPLNLGGASITNPHDSFTEWNDVGVRRLDSDKWLDDRLRRVDVIKVDCEGMDGAVLLGAENLLTGPHRPRAVYAEYNRAAFGAWKSLGTMEGWGYRLHVVDWDGSLTPATPDQLADNATLCWSPR